MAGGVAWNYCRCRGEPLTERHVQAIWYDRTIRPRNLSARDGTPVRVVDPGSWNLEAGPDFTDAVLELGRDRRRLRGDVEIHLDPRDWTVHRHGTNRAYERVVAHVTWRSGPVPDTLPPAAISICLGRFVTGEASFFPEHIDLGAYPFARLPADERPCCALLTGSPDLAGEVLAQAGRCRLGLKARRLRTLLAAADVEREEIFYREVMGALGYKKNSSGFRRVSKMVPYRTIKAEPENAHAALLAAAAFVEWDRTSARPRNSPAVRLAAAAEIFASTPIMDFAAAADFAPQSCREMVAALSAGGKIGRGRAGALIVNVVLPWAMAEGRVREIPDWLPPEDVSAPMRLTAFRMFGRDHNPRAMYYGNGLRLQGLLQIHRDFCLQVHPDCSDCALVAALVRTGAG